MKKSFGCIFLLSATALTAQAADQGLEGCIANAQKHQAGTMLKLEKLKYDGKPVYKLEIADANGFEWEFMCDANTGKVIEVEREAESVNSAAFKSKMKLTEEDAKAIALKAYPGVIEEVEYEIKENGDAVYEFDIVSDKDVETKVEVDAATGKIIHVFTEEWEIGEEVDEKR